jgi:hypothetical protein
VLGSYLSLWKTDSAKTPYPNRALAISRLVIVGDQVKKISDEEGVACPEQLLNRKPREGRRMVEKIGIRKSKIYIVV